MNESGYLRLENKVALVTGGSRGIGKVICQRLAQEGAIVAVNYYKNVDNAKQTVDDICNNGGAAIAIKADVRSAIDVKNLVDMTVQKFNRIDILVNSAGVVSQQYVSFFEEDEWDRVVDTNLKGTFLTMKYAGRIILKNGVGGRIINIASTAAYTAYATQSAYAASKAAVIALTRSAAKEFAQFGITVNSVSPGGTLTDMIADQNTTPERVKQVVPLGRLATPDEIASAIIFLVSDDASYVTGQDLCINGGEFM